MIWLVEVAAYDPAIVGTRTLRYASAEFVSRPTDDPANAFYDPRLEIPLNFQRHLFGAGTTSGQNAVGYGEIVVTNADGVLDPLLDYGFDGRGLTIKRVLDKATALSDAETWFVGTLEQAVFEWHAVRFRVRDRLAELDKPLQENRYLGTNALPAGVEGTEEDLKDRPKPVLVGYAENFSPPCVNTSRLIYQIHDGAVAEVNGVFDAGVSLTAGANYSSQSDMETNAPSASQYRAWLAGGMIRLGSTPVGTLTVNATEGATTADRTAAQIAKRLLLKGGLTTADLDPASFTSLDSANSNVCGDWIDSEKSTLQACADILNSIGGWLLPSRLGKFQVGRFAAPAGAPVKTYTEAEILETGGGLERLTTGDQGRGLPAWRVTVNHSRVFTVQRAGELAGATPASRKARVAQEWRSAVASDSAVKTKHKLAVELTFNTLLTSAGQAGTEAARRLALYKNRADRYRLRVTADLAKGVDLGSVIQLQVERFGLQNGKLFTVIGITELAETNDVELDCWGTG